MHLRHDIDAVDDERGATRHPQRNVKHRAVFRHIDPLAGKHGRPVALEARLLGQFQQEAHGLVSDPVLRIIEVDPGGFGAQPLAAPCILGEQLPQVAALYL